MKKQKKTIVRNSATWFIVSAVSMAIAVVLSMFFIGVGKEEIIGHNTVEYGLTGAGKALILAVLVLSLISVVTGLMAAYKAYRTIDDIGIEIDLDRATEETEPDVSSISLVDHLEKPWLSESQTNKAKSDTEEELDAE